MIKSFLVVAGVTFSLSGYCQNNLPQVEKQIKDPQRKSNAGKADVIVAKNKKIYDSTTFDKSTVEATRKKTIKSNPKKKNSSRKKTKGAN